jgi:hypothetical protein
MGYHMLDRSQVSACLVSREPIDPRILEALEGFGEIIVGDGAFGPYARYEAVAKAKFDIIYTQDDDCLVDIDALLELWDGNFLTNVRPERSEPCFDNSTLTGWGSLYRKELVQPALDRYIRKYGMDDLYRREADRIFSGLNKHILVCVKVDNLPNATGVDRLTDRPDHWLCRAEIQRRLENL